MSLMSKKQAQIQQASRCASLSAEHSSWFVFVLFSGSGKNQIKKTIKTDLTK